MRNAGNARKGSATAASTRPQTATTGPLAPSALRSERSRLPRRRSGTPPSWPVVRAGGLDRAIRATRTIKDYGSLFLPHHEVEGNTAVDALHLRVALAARDR